MSKQIKNKNIAQAINDLMSGADTSPIFTPGDHNSPQIEAYNLYDLFKDKLIPEAQKAMENKIVNLIHQRNEERPDLKGFFDLLHKTGNQGVDVNTVHMYSGGHRRVIDRVVFLGRVATVNKIEAAVEKVCSGLNRLAKRGYITGALSPLIGIKLQRIYPKEKSKIIVVSYVALTTIGEHYLNTKMKGHSFPEGGMPKRI